MKLFKNVDPIEVQTDSRVIFVFEESRDNKSENDYLYILFDQNYLIFATKVLYVYRNDDDEVKTRKWVGGTKLEIPKEALPWFVKTIEEKFFKTEAEGGLEKGKFGCEQ